MRWVIMWVVAGSLLVSARGNRADEKSGAEKAAAGWLYPGAKVISTSTGGPLSCVVHETEDDVGKVLKHYGRKTGTDLKEALPGGGESGAKGDTSGARVNFVIVRPKAMSAGGGAVYVATFRTNTECATLIISRRPDEKVTTITVSHTPLGEMK